jgi:hypothetical protein
MDFNLKFKTKVQFRADEGPVSLDSTLVRPDLADQLVKQAVDWVFASVGIIRGVTARMTFPSETRTYLFNCSNVFNPSRKDASADPKVPRVGSGRVSRAMEACNCKGEPHGSQSLNKLAVYRGTTFDGGQPA